MMPRIWNVCCCRLSMLFLWLAMFKYSAGKHHKKMVMRDLCELLRVYY